MERKKYYIVMFCVVSVSEFVMPAQSGPRSPAVQASYGTFPESDQKRLHALEKEFRLFNEQFQAHCLAQERAQTHNRRQIQTQARAALNQQQAIQVLQQASLAHEASIQAIKADIEELQWYVLQLDQEQAVTQQSVAALRNMVHLLIAARRVDDIPRREDELYEQQQRSRSSVVPRPSQGGQRFSLRRVSTSDALYQQQQRAGEGPQQRYGGWFVSDSEGD